MAINIFKKYNQSELLRLISLAALVSSVFWPFFSGLNMGAADAQWYQYILHDALIQFKQGIFPVYVGQSEFYFIGASDLRAPYYLLLAQFLNVITLGKLSSLFIQHLTVIFSAFMSAFLTYFVVVQLVPARRWFAVCAAFFYVTCPGVIGLIYGCDMYHSFMAVPYIPLVIYGLVRSSQKNDYFAYIITAMGLSLLWMAHPPIAVWTTGFCLLFYSLQFIFLRKGFLGLIILISIFLFLNLWQFVSVHDLGLRDYYQDIPDFVGYVLTILKGDIPGVFLPLQWAKGVSTPFLQLGYTLWIGMVFVFIFAIRSVRTFTLTTLVTCILLVFCLLYPIPCLTRALWWMMPAATHNLNLWPMQRLYCIFAALIIVSSVLVLKQLNSMGGLFEKRKLGLVLLVFLSWNFYQANYFVKMGQERKGTDSWGSNKSLFVFNNSLLPIHYVLPAMSAYKPRLKNKLINVEEIPIKGYNNELFDESDKLPIQIESFTPYKATVNSPRYQAYLEIFKEYFPGYEATVNGENVSVLKTKQGFIKIPLQKGFNQIELRYVGTLAMHMAFYISATAWLLLFIYLIRCTYNQIVRQWRWEEGVEF